MTTIEFRVRREELVAISAEGKLAFLFTMGIDHVYFPDEARWAELAPAWAKSRWREYLDACTQWCAENKVPLSVAANAYVDEES